MADKGKKHRIDDAHVVLEIDKEIDQLLKSLKQQNKLLAKRVKQITKNIKQTKKQPEL